MGFVQMAKVLISYGANKNAKVLPGAKRFVGYTPLQVARAKGHTNIAHLKAGTMQIQKPPSKKVLDQQAKEAWFEAAQTGNTQRLQHVYQEYNFDINMRGTRYNTSALVWAAWKGHLDAVKFLVKMGANISLKESNKTALEWAKQKKHTDVVKYLSSLNEL